MRPNYWSESLRRVAAVVTTLCFVATSVSTAAMEGAAAHPPKRGTTNRPSGLHVKRAFVDAQTVSPMHMPLVAPLFIQDRRFSSTLGMVNASNVSTFADVALTDLNGRQIAVKRVQFAPHSEQQLDILPILESSVSAATTGRLTISQDPSLQGMAVSAQLSMTFTGATNTNYIDEEVAMPSAEGSQTLRAVSDRSEGSPLVSITSLADTPQQIQILCIGEHEHHQKSIELVSQETVVTEACGSDTPAGWDLQNVLDRADDAPRGVTGISVYSDGEPGSFAAFGLSRRSKGGHEFFSSIDFSDPKMTMSADTVFTGVPIGSTPLLGDGQFVPELSLANFSNNSRHVTVNFARTSDGSPSSSIAADLTLEAGMVKHLKLENLQADPLLKNSFVVVSDGTPGDLLAKLVSVNDSDPDTQIVGVFGKDEKEMNNGGNHPWSVENGNESTILLFNHSATPQLFHVLICSGEIHWQKNYTLGPKQTETISVRQLITDGSKDDSGQVLTEKTKSGQLGWWNQDVGLGKGRLLLSNVATGMARNFSCSTLRGLCGIIYTADINTLTNGSTVLFASAVALVCEIYAVNQCNGTADTGTGGYTTSWSSHNAAVAAISGASNQSNVNVLGVSGGSTTVAATISSQYCTTSGGSPANVQVPTSLKVVSANLIPYTAMSGCLAVDYSIVAAIKYQVLDQNQKAIASAAMTPQEKVLKQVINGVNYGDPQPTWRNIGPTNYSGTSQNTDSNGQFLDAPIGQCASIPFTDTYTQPISVLLNGKSYTVRTNNWTTVVVSNGHGSFKNDVGDVNLAD